MDYEWTTVFWIASSRYIEQAFYGKSSSRLNFIDPFRGEFEKPFDPLSIEG